MTVITLKPRPAAGAQPYRRIAVIGAGAWGTALAMVAARAGRDVTLWARRPDHAAALAADGANRAYLGDHPLPAAIRPTADLATALRDADIALLATPSHAIRGAAAAVAQGLRPGAPIALTAKGVEKGTGLLMGAVAAQVAPGREIAALSGPSFAAEVARDLPTAVVIASECAADMDPEVSVAGRLAVTLGTETFRPYVSDDIVGVELGGAVKNVIALACGMADGVGFGVNARAALVTRGLTEITALVHALGGQRETVMGLSGLGDLTLTASDPQSRNFTFGRRVGRGEAVDAATLVEGAPNAVTITDLARARGVPMPICEAVRAVIHDGASFVETFRALWTSPIEAEPRLLEFALKHPAAS